MQPDTNVRPPAGLIVTRRTHSIGSVKLPISEDPRATLHLSERTATRCQASSRVFTRQRGDVDVTPACEQGGFDAEQECASLEVRLPSGFVEQVADELGINAGQRGLQARHMLRDERLTHLLLAIDAEYRAGSPSGRLYLDSLGVALAVRLLSDHSATTPVRRGGLSSLQLQRVLDFIEAHLDSNLSLGQLADVATVSSSHLKREFKASRGVSVHQYVVQRRVARARELLLRRSLPASQVALAAGFSHQSHMTRWMRRLLGVTPRELQDSPS